MKYSILPNNVLAAVLIVDQDLKLEIIDNMLTYGGSFVKCLAECVRTADDTNLGKIVMTWPTYIKEYLPENWVGKGGVKHEHK